MRYNSLIKRRNPGESPLRNTHDVNAATTNGSISGSISNTTISDTLSESYHLPNDEMNSLNMMGSNALNPMPTNMEMDMDMNMGMDTMNPTYCRSRVRSRPRARSKQRSSSSNPSSKKRYHRHHRSKRDAYTNSYNDASNRINVNAMNHNHNTLNSTQPFNNLHAHVHLHHANGVGMGMNPHHLGHSHSHMQLPSMSVHSYLHTSSSTPQLHSLTQQQQQEITYDDEEEEYTSNKMSKPCKVNAGLNLFHHHHPNHISEYQPNTSTTSIPYPSFKFQNLIPMLRNFYYTQCQPKWIQTQKSIFGHNHNNSTGSLLNYNSISSKTNGKLKSSMKNSKRSRSHHRRQQQQHFNQQQQQQQQQQLHNQHYSNYHHHSGGSTSINNSTTYFKNGIDVQHKYNTDHTNNCNSNDCNSSDCRHCNGRSSSTSSPSSLSSSSSQHQSQSLYSNHSNMTSSYTRSSSPPPLASNYNYNYGNSSYNYNNNNNNGNMNPYYYYYYAKPQQQQQQQQQQLQHSQKYTIKYYIKRYLQIFSCLFVTHLMFVHIYNGFHIPNTCHVAQLSKEKLKLLSWIGRDVDYIIMQDDVIPWGDSVNGLSGVGAMTVTPSVSVPTNATSVNNHVNQKKDGHNYVNRRSKEEIKNADDTKATEPTNLASMSKPTKLRKKSTQLDENEASLESKHRSETNDINSAKLSPLPTQQQHSQSPTKSAIVASATTTAATISATETVKKEPFSPTLSKIIHHQWKDSSIPPTFDKWYKRWRELYPEPEYKHILWTDESARELIEKHYIWFLPTYDNYDLNIKRADSSRYFILHHMGGIYADLDYEPLINFYDYLPKNQVGLIESPYLYNEKIQNSLMTSPKGDPFWIHVFQGLAQNADMAVLHATGPKFLDEMMDTSKHPVYTLPCENFHRIPYGELNDSKWTAVLVRELVTRIVPMSKHCGYINEENSCQFGKHHNTAGWTSESFF